MCCYPYNFMNFAFASAQCAVSFVCMRQGGPTSLLIVGQSLSERSWMGLASKCVRYVVFSHPLAYIRSYFEVAKYKR